MKPLKNAKQKSVRLNKYHYTREVINMMLREGYAFYFVTDSENHIKISREELNVFNAVDIDDIWIPLDKVEKLKVIYDEEEGCYKPVAFIKDDYSTLEYVVIDI